MGGCCSHTNPSIHHPGDGGSPCPDYDDGDEQGEDGKRVDMDGQIYAAGGGRRNPGSVGYASVYTQQGWKGVNQDAMTIWEDFAGSRDRTFCAVFDGHGPYGHRVSSHVRDNLPAILSSMSAELSNGEGGELDHAARSAWADVLVKAFQDMDGDLWKFSGIDCFCSGTTAVVVIREREHLIIANLGDSRSILCTRDERNQPVPVQLTTDLKPNVPGEAERIKSCRGRVFALAEEPDVHRIWLPEDDTPGLAMARAFGDFCLKDFGLISTPQISYRKLSEKDEFVVLATDGVWDALSNTEVVKIVSSCSKRSASARQLVQRAVKSWRRKYPMSKVDDCAVICLFLKQAPSSTPTSIETPRGSENSHTLSHSESFCTARSEETLDPEGNRMGESSQDHSWSALEGFSRANSVLKLPRFATNMLSWRKQAAAKVEERAIS